MQYQTFVEKLTKQDYLDIISRVSSKEMMKLLHGVIGISGEAGELTDALKKHIIYGKEFDKQAIIEELGDLLFYITMACNALNITLEQLAVENAKKLAVRYQSLQYSDAEAIERKDKTTSAYTNPNESPRPE